MINKELELIANKMLASEEKPNYSNRDFLNTVIIFQSALMDKMYEVQERENMDLKDRMKMAEVCGKELKKFIHTYTGLDTYQIEELLST